MYADYYASGLSYGICAPGSAIENFARQHGPQRATSGITEGTTLWPLTGMKNLQYSCPIQNTTLLHGKDLGSGA